MKTSQENLYEYFHNQYQLSLNNKEITQLLLIPNLENDLAESDCLSELNLLHIIKSLDLNNSLSFAKQYGTLQIVFLKGLSKDYLTLLFQREDPKLVDNIIIKHSPDLNTFFDFLKCIDSNRRLPLLQKRLKSSFYQLRFKHIWDEETSLFKWNQIMRFREILPRGEDRQAFIDSYAEYKLYDSTFTSTNNSLIEHISAPLKAQFFLNNFKRINAITFPNILNYLPEADRLKTSVEYISRTTIADKLSPFETGNKLSLSEFKRTLCYFPSQEEKDKLTRAYFLSLNFNPILYKDRICFCIHSGALSQEFIAEALLRFVFGDGNDSFDLIIDFLTYLDEPFQMCFLNHIMHVTNNIYKTVRILRALKENNKLPFLERINLLLYKDINQEIFLTILDLTPSQNRYALITEYIEIVKTNFRDSSDYHEILNRLNDDHKTNFESLLQLHFPHEEKPSYCLMM